MTDRPILFSAPMVRALLDGRKTQTRRLLRAPTQFDDGMVAGICHHSRTGWARQYPGGACACRPVKAPHHFWTGDRLWVRETWFREYPGTMYYRADPEPQVWLQGRWKPSIHMHRCDSRLTLVVTKTKIERLQEITSADAIAEGCPAHANSQTIDCDTKNPRDDFARLWDRLHGEGAWGENPEVVALTFTVHKANIGRTEAAA